MDRDTLDNFGQGPVVFVDSRSSYVTSEKQLVALFGVENLVVVTTDDAVLVAKRQNGDGLQRLVQEVKKVAPMVTEIDHGAHTRRSTAGRAFRSSALL